MYRLSPKSTTLTRIISYREPVPASITQHAHAAEHLLPFLHPGAKVLDVGSGSGYLTAVLHYIVSSDDPSKPGKVVGIDHIPELVQSSVQNLKADGLGKALENGQIEMITGDGRQGLWNC